MGRKSNTDSAEPRRAHPYKENECFVSFEGSVVSPGSGCPKIRTKDRIDTAEAKLDQSNVESVEPQRAIPYKEHVESNLVKERNDIELPRLTLSRTENALPSLVTP
jgi:hypothetical protein